MTTATTQRCWKCHALLLRDWGGELTCLCGASETRPTIATPPRCEGCGKVLALIVTGRICHACANPKECRPCADCGTPVDYTAMCCNPCRVKRTTAARAALRSRA